ncbi:tRNA pseudouridine(38-40) synthase TruA [Natronobacterium gregoryi]|uniref:tRNA pseudouridine synthase A n=2 Tax=Natronobacterium gregoryi TaxID=44930 RepID=L0AJS9_NATGS|nr:tRNA pseudouridine(38-40) synthase TruA [Natronobacterium gregoryi]AFZ73442.1 pseudouridylate synthase [Natronobacterium gregoryi SP2]ELY68639.1 tRNA pseudouridine synthase A [Natronobacterium gregoryi SP2]PLK20449.1 tRNA pseudouridine(38-40) synthase TruA [Natronobacterium gregoryi SP2]SFI71820.1 tRNA pseudouridine38-40 synthase [Natronobacterium gregoryi]
MPTPRTPSSTSNERALRAFRIAYDGTDYYGYQRQPSVPTVEDAIFEALRSLEVLAPDAEKPTGYAAAGRTDRGVSALAQTIGLETPDWLTPRAFNAALPADVRAWASADAPEGFHATHHATRREYTYQLYAPPADGGTSRSLESSDCVDDELVQAACRALSGSHDYHNLTPDDDPDRTERTLSIEAIRDGDYLVVTVAADGFAHQLVRRLVSLVQEIGTGASPLEKVDRVFSPEPLPGPEGVAPAPPEPLVLTGVAYPNLAFTVDEPAAESAQAVFGERTLERRTGARVAGQLAAGVGTDRDL